VCIAVGVRVGGYKVIRSRRRQAGLSLRAIFELGTFSVALGIFLNIYRWRWCDKLGERIVLL
jgi:hypothetical protein